MKKNTNEKSSFDILINSLKAEDENIIDILKNCLLEIEQDPPHPIDVQVEDVTELKYSKYIMSLAEKTIPTEFKKYFSMSEYHDSINFLGIEKNLFIAIDITKDDNHEDGRPIFDIYMGFEYDLDHSSIIIMEGNTRYKTELEFENYDDCSTYKINHNNSILSIDYNRNDSFNENAVEYIFNNLTNDNIDQMKDIISLNFDAQYENSVYEKIFDCILKENEVVNNIKKTTQKQKLN